MRKLGFLFLIVLVVACVGLWRGWFVVEARERPQPRVLIDREKVADDAAALTDSAVAAFKSRSKPASSGNGAIEVAATPVRVDSSASSIDLRVGGDVFTVGIDSEVAILVDGKSAALGQLSADAPVTLHLTPTADGKSLRVTRVVQ